MMIITVLDNPATTSKVRATIDVVLDASLDTLTSL